MKKPLYNFGISQEDALTEMKALKLKEGDALLCVASGGEIPLNILAKHKIKIVSCDTSIEQIYLSKLKLASVLHLSQEEAAKLIGFLKCNATDRQELYNRIKDRLSIDEQRFWENNQIAIDRGIVNVARFEKYILKFSWVLRTLLGKRKLKKLIELQSVEEQCIYFDQKISNWWIKLIFKIAFHPKIYKNRGMDEHGLQHQKDDSIASFFYGRFRDFCTSTLVSKNYYFQYTFFNTILCKEALPEYLSAEGMKNIRNNFELLSFVHQNFTEALLAETKGTFNKFHLSNIGDWLTSEQMNEVFKGMYEMAASNSNFILRYIHRNHSVPVSVSTAFNFDSELSVELTRTDRYPFYHIQLGTVNSN